jgi:hypothetical protein
MTTSVNGTMDLFAGMNGPTGEVLYDTRTSNKSTDVLQFFVLIDLHVAENSTSASSSTT